MLRTVRLSLLLPLAGVLAPHAAGSLQPSGETLTDYAVTIDNVQGPWINLNFSSIRPMVLVGTSLYAVNTHDSTVERFVTGQAAPADVWGVPWGPVSIARWSSGQSEELLVVCRGSHALVRLDVATGEVLGLIELPPEPGDLLVVDDDAYVSCTGVDRVVEVDLASGSVTREWSEATHPVFRQKSPLFLSYDDTEGNDRVLVAPLTSGNGSTVEGPNSNLQVVSTVAWPLPLPDEDLFAIDRASGAISVVATGLGSILFAHGVHPTTKDFWLLATDAINDDPTPQSEPLVKGRFSENRISILSYDEQASALASTPTQIVVLDDPPRWRSPTPWPSTARATSTSAAS